MKKLTQDDRRIAIGPSRSKNLHSGLAKYDTITAKYQYGWWARSQKYTTCICPSILRKHHLESSTGQINHSFYPNPSPSGLSLIFPAGGLILLGFYFIFSVLGFALGLTLFHTSCALSLSLCLCLSVSLCVSLSCLSFITHFPPVVLYLSLSLSLFRLHFWALSRSLFFFYFLSKIPTP